MWWLHPAACMTGSGMEGGMEGGMERAGCSGLRSCPCFASLGELSRWAALKQRTARRFPHLPASLHAPCVHQRQQPLQLAAILCFWAAIARLQTWQGSNGHMCVRRPCAPLLGPGGCAAGTATDSLAHARPFFPNFCFPRQACPQHLCCTSGCAARLHPARWLGCDR